jgi:hypothetical protein
VPEQIVPLENLLFEPELTDTGRSGHRQENARCIAPKADLARARGAARTAFAMKKEKRRVSK